MRVQPIKKNNHNHMQHTIPTKKKNKNQTTRTLPELYGALRIPQSFATEQQSAAIYRKCHPITLQKTHRPHTHTTHQSPPLCPTSPLLLSVSICDIIARHVIQNVSPLSCTSLSSPAVAICPVYIFISSMSLFVGSISVLGIVYYGCVLLWLLHVQCKYVYDI